jgi:hypothetical protein
MSKELEKAVAPTKRIVSLCYLQSAVTMGHMAIQGVTTLGSPNTSTSADKVTIVKVPGGIELSNKTDTAFIPDGNIKILAYKV